MVKLGKTVYHFFHYNAKPDIFEKAIDLRRSMTNAEKMLWQKLKNRQLDGYKFRRQHPIHIFIVDFYCHQLRLAIEIDGKIHEEKKEYDEGRTAELERYGITVIRFTNEQVENNISEVVHQIRYPISSKPLPTPSLPYKYIML